jgi:pantoate--beta-alanine ligase
MSQWSKDRRGRGLTISFVPTMGFLHEGHLSLMREAKRRCDLTVVSIFVNPTQFGPQEDFDAYPRDLNRDLKMAESAGADLVFTPERNDLYPEGFDTFLVQEKLPGHLCGLSRPGHFRGVLTIVAKLFHIVNPHAAVFGEKDYQQLAVIRRMAKDLHFDITIVGYPIVREPDGLAMSSRNVRLSAGQRTAAACLYQSLVNARQMVADGETDPEKILSAAAALINAQPEAEIDYIKICDPGTLDDVSSIGCPVVMAVAVKIGRTRLIDNMILSP